MKIVTSKEHRRNQSVTINGITVKFDTNLQSEVTEKEFEIISAKDDSIELFEVEGKKDEKKKVEGEDESKTDSTETQEQTETDKPDKTGENEDNSSKDMKAELLKMNMKELKDLAAEGNLPETEWKNFKKKEDLANYLSDKLKG
jgi:hypothetical protein